MGSQTGAFTPAITGFSVARRQGNGPEAGRRDGRITRHGCGTGVTSTNKERELKLAGRDDVDVPTDRLGPFTLGPERVIGLTATYFDTADLRLARSGASLRYREPEGWTAKLPSVRGRLMKRTEVTVVGPQTAPVPTQLLDVLTALTRGAAVRPIATLHTERRARVIRDDRGR